MIFIFIENFWYLDFKIFVIFFIFREVIIILELLGVELIGDLEMVEVIRKEVRWLCCKDVIVVYILYEDYLVEYISDYKCLFIIDNVEGFFMCVVLCIMK